MSDNSEINSIQVIKATGEKEPFSENKLRSSIGRAGIPREMHDKVVAHVESILRPDITTREIYSHIIEFLGKSAEPHLKSKYSLKQAIMALGPSGYPFEKYVAELMKARGFTTETDMVIQGKCVSHEIDVIATRDEKKIMVECKFHNQSGTRSDVKIALYVEARFEDLAGKFNEGWLVTNTKCTTDAIAYGECRGLKIIAWGYPEKGNFAELVEESKLYPVTVLSSLSGAQKKMLLSRGVVLCKDLLAGPSDIKSLHLSPEDEKLLIEELRGIVDHV